MLFPMEDQVGMDLVGNHQHVVFKADRKHPFQFFLRPYPSQGIVGIAEDEKLHLRVLCLSFKVFKVHFPYAVPLQEVILHQGPSGIFCDIEKFRVHRRLDQDLFSLLGKQLDDPRQGRDHSQAPAAERRIKLPAVSSLLPVCIRLKIAVRPGGITPDPFLRFLFAGVDDGLGRLKIHIRDP